MDDALRRERTSHLEQTREGCATNYGATVSIVSFCNSTVSPGYNYADDEINPTRRALSNKYVSMFLFWVGFCSRVRVAWDSVQRRSIRLLLARASVFGIESSFPD